MLVAERNGVASAIGSRREERQLHARLALRDAIAHGGHAPRDLGGCANLTCEQLDLIWIAPIMSTRRKHVVVGRDDADVDCFAVADRDLLLASSGKAMCEIAPQERVGRSTRSSPLANDQIEQAGAWTGIAWRYAR